MSFVLYLAASLIAIAMTKSDVGNGGKFTFLIVAILSASEVIAWNLWGKKMIMFIRIENVDAIIDEGKAEEGE